MSKLILWGLIILLNCISLLIIILTFLAPVERTSLVQTGIGNVKGALDRQDSILLYYAMFSLIALFIITAISIAILFKYRFGDITGL